MRETGPRPVGHGMIVGPGFDVNRRCAQESGHGCARKRALGTPYHSVRYGTHRFLYRYYRMVAAKRLSPLTDAPLVWTKIAYRGSIANPRSTLALATLFNLAASGHLKVPATQRCPLDRGAEAHRALQNRLTIGKVVLIP